MLLLMRGKEGGRRAWWRGEREIEAGMPRGEAKGGGWSWAGGSLHTEKRRRSQGRMRDDPSGGDSGEQLGRKKKRFAAFASVDFKINSKKSERERDRLNSR
jgi:hypothetical protein